MMRRKIRLPRTRPRPGPTSKSWRPSPPPVQRAEDARDRETPERFAERVKGMTVSPRLFEVGEEGWTRILAADRVVEYADFDAGAGTVLEGLGEGLAGAVVEENVGFEPDAG